MGQRLLAVSLPDKLYQVVRVIAFHEKKTFQAMIVDILWDGVEKYREMLDKMAPGTLDPK